MEDKMDEVYADVLHKRRELRREFREAATELAMADGKLRNRREQFEKAHAAIDDMYRDSVAEANDVFVQAVNKFFELAKQVYAINNEEPEAETVQSLPGEGMYIQRND